MQYFPKRGNIDQRRWRLVKQPARERGERRMAEMPRRPFERRGSDEAFLVRAQVDGRLPVRLADLTSPAW
jgi:hypothetical protein